MKAKRPLVKHNYLVPSDRAFSSKLLLLLLRTVRLTWRAGCLDRGAVYGPHEEG